MTWFGPIFSKILNLYLIIKFKYQRVKQRGQYKIWDNVDLGQGSVGQNTKRLTKIEYKKWYATLPLKYNGYWNCFWRVIFYNLFRCWGLAEHPCQLQDFPIALIYSVLWQQNGIRILLIFSPMTFLFPLIQWFKFVQAFKCNWPK